MRLDDQNESSNFEIQGPSRAGFGGGGGGLGLLGMLFPFVLSRFGCGGVVVLLIAVAIFGGFGSIGSLLGTGAGVDPTPRQAGAQAGQQALTPGQSTSLKVLGSTEAVWTRIFAADGKRYEPTILSFYDRNGQSGCGAAQSAMGPFYCPSDRKTYIDTTFFDEMKTRFDAPGDFPIGYIISHEVGHHIQTITGIADEVAAQQARVGRAAGNALQVKMELQADCYAGVWAANARGLLEAGDVEEGMRAAAAIGDDTLQRESQGTVVPESFTHGSSAQRQFWLQRGLQTGDWKQCDTFAS